MDKVRKFTANAIVRFEVEIESSLFEQLVEAATATDSSTGIVREAIIYYLYALGFHEVENFETRFAYVMAQRTLNNARKFAAGATASRKLVAAKSWMLAAARAKECADVIESSRILTEEHKRNPIGCAAYETVWHGIAENMGKAHSADRVLAADVTAEVNKVLLEVT